AYSITRLAAPVGRGRNVRRRLPGLCRRPKHPKYDTVSLHDALPISSSRKTRRFRCFGRTGAPAAGTRQSTRLPASASERGYAARSEEHMSELQSRGQLVCRLLLEKTKHPVACTC